MNSIPSYFMLDISVSGNRISPSKSKAVMYVEVLPSSSSVRNATITVSSDVGMNLKEEKPLVAIEWCIFLKEKRRK